MPLLYSIAIVLVFTLLLPVLLLHPKTRSGFKQRLGWYPPEFGKGLEQRAGPRIWLHGASAGDLLALLPIYEELKARAPKASFIISTMTNSGEAIAHTRFADAQLFTFVPWDLPWSTRAAMRRIRPDLLVLEYTEIWPNLIRAARGVGARVAVTNGRFSEKNMGRYQLLFTLTGNVLHQIDLLLMREEAEAERVRQLGARERAVRVTGNTKFDALLLGAASSAPEELAWSFGLGTGDRVLVAGSTHEGEEGPLLDVYEELLDEFPDLRLLIAPRYTERVPRIAALIQARGLEVTCRSGKRFEESLAGSGGGKGRKSSRGLKSVLILDTIGELNSAYRLATLVFVGGSFTTRGGQNILEPAARGKAVLFGPHMQNFRDSVQVLLGRGGIQVNDPEHLLRVARELLSQPEKLEQLGALARQVVSQIRGASSRNAELLLELLGQEGDSPGEESEFGPEAESRSGVQSESKSESRAGSKSEPRSALRSESQSEPGARAGSGSGALNGSELRRDLGELENDLGRDLKDELRTELASDLQGEPQNDLQSDLNVRSALRNNPGSESELWSALDSRVEQEQGAARGIGFDGPLDASKNASKGRS